MNKKQKIVFLIGIVVVVQMGLYPPWTLRSEVLQSDNILPLMISGYISEEMRVFAPINQLLYEIYHPIWSCPIRISDPLLLI